MRDAGGPSGPPAFPFVGGECSVRDRFVLHTLWIATAVAILVPSFADPDLWGHLLFGSALLGGNLHLENTFAYTTPAQPWLNHELLAELTMAGAWQIGGA